MLNPGIFYWISSERFLCFVNEMTPQEELTGGRPVDYSKWHRPPNLPKWCYHTDGDWFEQRLCEGELRSVACIETIKVAESFVERAQCDYKLWASKKALLKEIHLLMKLPCFVVRHTAGCHIAGMYSIFQFSVSRFIGNGEAKADIMSEDTYKNFIIGLKPTHPCSRCGSTDWWWRQNEWAPKGEWLCNRCHPCPVKKEIPKPGQQTMF